MGIVLRTSRSTHPKSVTSVSSLVSLGLRCFLERRQRLVECNPRQFIFEEDRFLRRNDAGSSSDAIVTSIISESLLSSKNKCVPQHAAKQRIRFACAILRASPFVTDRSSRGTDRHVT